MYLLAITFAMCCAYFGLTFLFSLFFENKIPTFTRKSLYAVLLIIFLSIGGYIIAFSIPDIQLGNRFLHAFGGGFISFIICFLVVKDSQIKLNLFQFFVFSVMVVTTLGVGNEILELFLQKFAGFIFSMEVRDTWYDLLSNTIGLLIAALIFVPLLNKIQKKNSLQ